MKKIFCFIVALILLTGCDDGEMTFQKFNFTGTLKECSLKTGTYIMTTGTEALIIDLAATPLVNIESAKNSAGDPISRNIALGANALEYRVYTSTVTSDNICNATGNASVTIKDRWQGTGNLGIITTKKTDSKGVITFIHSITLTDATFTKDGETIRIEDNYLNTVTTSMGVTLNFANDNESDPINLSICEDNSNLKYWIKNNQSILLQFAPGTLNNAGTEDVIEVPLNADLTAATANNITITVYSGNGMTSEGICTRNKPVTPTEKSRWVATSGNVVLKRSLISGAYYYDVYLAKDIAFYNRTNIGSGEFFNPEPNFPDSTGDFADYYYLGRIAN
ncbi:membrane lipoprotein lipid attachment site-containing protein [Flavobacterium psychrotrophum]|uniref:membrane lipoprotein lipid attachment site-containing protein n=1 Tax=Flavobacterium psychrotrophum TaxID=2294119 RepID=UPI000E31FD2C|nr:membrane lipoprotein lipid attachment site-containing protein [Flavobacterium psychrotrophum]